LVSGGKVLVAGGSGPSDIALAGAELLNPDTGAWTEGISKIRGGPFQFAFSNTPAGRFNVSVTTNLQLALANWTPAGGAVEMSPGQFQFTDPQATNSQRFYSIHP
jgi:hypothetical protein